MRWFPFGYAGLDPAIHHLAKRMDAPINSGHDEERQHDPRPLVPAHAGTQPFRTGFYICGMSGMIAGDPEPPASERAGARGGQEELKAVGLGDKWVLPEPVRV